MTAKNIIIKKQKLRNAEYYDFQSVQDKLHELSGRGKIFNNLIEIITAEENIKLAYRNIKKNKGSYTAGTDRKNIKDLAKWQDERLIEYVRKNLNGILRKRYAESRFQNQVTRLKSVRLEYQQLWTD